MPAKIPRAPAGAHPCTRRTPEPSLEGQRGPLAFDPLAATGVAARRPGPRYPSQPGALCCSPESGVGVPGSVAGGVLSGVSRAIRRRWRRLFGRRQGVLRRRGVRGFLLGAGRHQQERAQAQKQCTAIHRVTSLFGLRFPVGGETTGRWVETRIAGASVPSRARTGVNRRSPGSKLEQKRLLICTAIEPLVSRETRLAAATKFWRRCDARCDRGLGQMPAAGGSHQQRSRHALRNQRRVDHHSHRHQGTPHLARAARRARATSRPNALSLQREWKVRSSISSSSARAVTTIRCRTWRPAFRRDWAPHAAAAMDVNTACTSFLYGLSTATAMIRTGVVRNALVIGAELISPFMDWTDRQRRHSVR